MKKKLQIFISSTYSDLIDERQAAVSAILKAGHIPAGMELFTSGDESQMTTIKRWIDESDVFMLILGGRYGSLEPTTSLSYTELEYDYAITCGKPYFAVVIEEGALDQKVKDKGKGVIESENNKELKLFREKVLSKISAFFKDSRDIRLAVHETVADLISRYEFKGWVSGVEIPDIQLFTDQINKLREENEKLFVDNEELKQRSAEEFPNSVNEINYDELVDKLKAIQIKLNISSLTDKNKNKDNYDLGKIKALFRLPEETTINSEPVVSIFSILKSIQDILITGVYNRSNSNTLVRLLFFNVMPKLQIYSLASSELVSNVAYRRFALTEKGIDFLRYVHDNNL